MSNKTRWLFLCGILIIAIFLRFYHFTTTPPGLYPDEAADGNNAVQAAETNHFQPFYTEDNGREGLYVNLIAAFLKVWPVYEPWVIRLPAAIAGVLTVLGLYFLGTELFDPATGLLAAFLLATSFWHINFSRIGFRAILAPMLLIWTAYFLIQAFKADSQKKAWLYTVLAGIIYGAGFYTYIAYRITPLLFLLFIPFFKDRKHFWKWTFLFLAVTIIVAAPIGWYFYSHPGSFFGRTAQISVTNSANPIGIFATNVGKELLMLDIRGDYNWRHNISGAPELYWPVGIVFLLGTALGIYALIKRWRNRRGAPAAGAHDPAATLPVFSLLMIAAWFALAILPAAASNDGIPHALRSILMLPPVMLLAAIGALWTYRMLKDYGNNGAAKVVATGFIIAVGLAGFVNYFCVWAKDPNVAGAFNTDYVEVATAMNALPAGTPKYVVVTAGGVVDHGVPVPANTVMFLTHSFTPEDQMKENIHYIIPAIATTTIPADIPSNEIFYIR